VLTASPTISVPQLASGTVTIDAGDHFFSPARLTVAVGTPRTDPSPRRYPYFCTPHAGDGMTGEIIVQ